MNSMNKHFSPAGERCLHMFLGDVDRTTISIEVGKAARELDFHFAILDGTQVQNKTSLFSALARLYEFPGDEPSYQRLNWDSVNDWISDLTWLTGWPVDKNKFKGFLLLYLDPLVLFSSDPVSLALFLSIIDGAAQEFAKYDLPFHLVLGPLNHEALLFIELLKAGNHTCGILHSDWPNEPREK